MARQRSGPATAACLLLLALSLLIGAATAPDLDLSNIQATPAVERKGGSAVGKMLPKHEKWVEMETKGTKVLTFSSRISRTSLSFSLSFFSLTVLAFFL